MYLFYVSVATGQDAGDVLELCVAADIGFDEEVDEGATGIQELATSTQVRQRSHKRYVRLCRGAGAPTDQQGSLMQRPGQKT